MLRFDVTRRVSRNYQGFYALASFPFVFHSLDGFSYPLHQDPSYTGEEKVEEGEEPEPDFPEDGEPLSLVDLARLRNSYLEENRKTEEILRSKDSFCLSQSKAEVDYIHVANRYPFFAEPLVAKLAVSDSSRQTHELLVDGRYMLDYREFGGHYGDSFGLNLLIRTPWLWSLDRGWGKLDGMLLCQLEGSARVHAEEMAFEERRWWDRMPPMTWDVPELDENGKPTGRVRRYFDFLRPRKRKRYDIVKVSKRTGLPKPHFDPRYELVLQRAEQKRKDLEWYSTRLNRAVREEDLRYLYYNLEESHVARFQKQTKGDIRRIRANFMKCTLSIDRYLHMPDHLAPEGSFHAVNRTKLYRDMEDLEQTYPGLLGRRYCNALNTYLGTLEKAGYIYGEDDRGWLYEKPGDGKGPSPVDVKRLGDFFYDLAPHLSFEGEPRWVNRQLRRPLIRDSDLYPEPSWRRIKKKKKK